MRPVQRWGLAALATALLLLTPYAGRLRPVHDSGLGASDLAAAVRDSAGTPYSGTVEIQGNVALPIADHFTDLADLFGSSTRLSVWWRGSDDWRVDRLLDTGEVDLFHHESQTTEWDYERGEAQVAVDPAIRLPRDSDLLPPQVARWALDGVHASDVSRLSPRRIAGVDAAGLRIEITDPRSSLDHVDAWVDPGTGVALGVEVYGDGSQPVVSTSFITFSGELPDRNVTRFRPAPLVAYRDVHFLDFADAADQFAPFDAPATLDGFPRTTGTAAAVYGSGLTRILLVPLPPQDADDLARRLNDSGARQVHGQPLLRVGPLGVLVSGRESFGPRWLLTGTVTDQALLGAAAELPRELHFR